MVQMSSLGREGQSPIHIAGQGLKHNDRTISGYWRVAALRIFLDHGANPNLLDSEGLPLLAKRPMCRTPCESCSGRVPMQRLEPETPCSGLFLTRIVRCWRCLLLDNGVSVDSPDEKRHSRAVDYILIDSRKVYALLCTAFAEELNSSVSSSIPLLRALVTRGADLYLPLNDDKTMIHFLFQFPQA